MNEIFNVILIILFVAVCFFIYFLPTFLAAFRKHHNSVAILMLNLFLGWTFIGWVISIVWASTEVKE